MRELCIPVNTIRGAIIYLKGEYVEERTLMEFIGIMEIEILGIERTMSRCSVPSLSYDDAPRVEKARF